MIQIKMNINNIGFIARVESYLKEQVTMLFNLIKNIELNEFRDNFNIQIGWNIFTLRKIEEGFIILAPDYNKNPTIDKTDDLTLALKIHMEQMQLLNKLNIEGEMISFQDKIVCSKGVLNLNDIYLERRDKCDERDSGWFIGAVNNTEESKELEAYYAYQILKIRPCILKVLTLPKEYIVVYDKDNLEAILNENDIDILKN